MSNAYINFTFESKTDWVKKINECQKEIERQEEIIRQLDIKNLELTNIINEFEEWLNAKYEEMHDIWYVKVLNKLKELKGSEKLTEKDKNQIRWLKEEFKIGDKE